MLFRILILWLLLCASFVQAAPIDHDILAVRVPRAGDATVTLMPDVTDPLGLPPGSQLILWHHDTGMQEVFVDPGPNGTIFDPVVSLDGQWVGYSRCGDVRQRPLPIEGCSLWKKHLVTHEEVLLVDHAKTWFPLESYANWSQRPDRSDPPGRAYPGYGVYNMGLAFLPSPDGQDCFIFTSNMDGLDTLKWDSATSVSSRMWRQCHGVMEQVWFAPTSVLHPALRADGRIMFSTLENALLGDGRRWGLWEMNPDGTSWGPSMSATKDPFNVPHFCTGTTDNNVVCAMYYPFNNNGFGTLLKWPITTIAGTNLQPPFFGSPNRKLNPKIPQGGYPWQYAYTPVGLHSLTPWTFQNDRPAPKVHGVYVGKLSHPWQTRGGLLVAYSGGPVQEGTTPQANSGIYLIPDGAPTDEPNDLVAIVNPDPAYNFLFPRPVLSWTAIYGSNPAAIGDIANLGGLHGSLPPGTPYALVQSPTVCYWESMAGQGTPGWKGQRPTFGGSDETIDTNYDSQGADNKPDITCNEIAAIRFIALGGIPLIRVGDPAAGFKTNTFVAGNQETRQVLGVVPLHKADTSGKPIMDPTGKYEDTSFQARIPADTPFAFELIDSKGRVLTHTPTWRQARPGEIINGCTGCHTHNTIVPYIFKQTVAGKPAYVPTDLTQTTLYTSEFKRNVAPLLETHCTACHNPTTNAGNLDLQTTTTVKDQHGYPLPRNAAVFLVNTDGKYGGKPPPPGYRLGNGYTSRWTHPYAAIKGLLSWILWGERLDGFSDDTFVSEPFPAGTPVTAVDLDLTDILRQAHASLKMTDAERFLIDHWVDEGMPVDSDPSGKRGWRSDVWRPVLTFVEEAGSTATVTDVTCTCAQCPCECPCPPGQQIIIGAHDVGSGLDMATFRVQRDGADIVLDKISGDRWTTTRIPGTYMVIIADKAGNKQWMTRRVQ